jgi:hypothetical protein
LSMHARRKPSQVPPSEDWHRTMLHSERTVADSKIVIRKRSTRCRRKQPTSPQHRPPAALQRKPVSPSQSPRKRMLRGTPRPQCPWPNQDHCLYDVSPYLAEKPARRWLSRKPLSHTRTLASGEA